jgi:hypothetical protein
MAPSLIKALASIALLHAPLQARASSSRTPTLSSNGQEWVSLSKNVEFLPVSYDSPAADNPHAPYDDASRFLRRAQERVLSKYSSQTFAEGASESHYSEYATAWRLLGVYIDCSASNAQEQRQRRRLDEEEGADENEDEEGDDNEGQQEQQQEEEQNSSIRCPRYLLWEAVRTTGSILAA